MTFTFVCQNCDDSFELDYGALTESTKGVKCESCGKKLAAADLEDLVSGVDAVLEQVAALRKRFLISFDVDGEDLPPPYDTEGKRRAADEDEDEEEDEDSDEDELSDDEDLGGDDEDDDDRF